MLVTTILVFLVAQSFAKDLAPHAHQQILNENVESRIGMAYYDSTHMSKPHYKINVIYEQKKTNEVTEFKQIKEEIVKYMHHHHRPTTTTTTTEAQQNIEVVNEKDIKESTNHSSSETPITVIEKHHHKHEEKEVASTLAPMPPAPKLRKPAVNPHLPTALPVKVKNELKQLLAHGLRRIPHKHPDHRLHISRTTSEAPVEVETRTELSPHVTQSDNILHSVVPESHFADPSTHELRPNPQRHLDHRTHVSQTTSEAHVGEEGQMELSPLVTQSDNMEEIPNNDVQGSPLDHPDSPAHELRPTPHRHPDHRLHISRTTSEAPVEEEARTELSPPATQWEQLEEIQNNDLAGYNLDHQDFPAYEPRPISHRHPDHRLRISHTTSKAPVEIEARTNHASTEKSIHLSPISHDPSFLSRKDQNTLAKIRPKFVDVQHGSRPVHRGSYKFSWDDINDMHASTVPKVSQLKENPNPPPVPTLSPWYDGYGK